MASVDAKWQRTSKARRAAVYRAVGRAARLAREDREGELADDLRTVMNVLRAHAAAPRRPAAKRRKKRAKR